ncbi:MAG: FMN-dependent NADH-azoreductase [Woeseiaceae bacterium]
MKNRSGTARPLRVLQLDSSGRRQDSASRSLTDALVDALESRHSRLERRRRDLADGIPFVDEPWIEANSTPAEARSRAQRAALGQSDRLVEELSAADVLVIGVPLYNFGIPASLKAWIDMVLRARRTFRYTENGPEGLLKGKKAYLVVASGGVAIGSDADFATPYLRFALAFIGITDVEIVAAEKLDFGRATAMDEARARIAELVCTTPALTADAA